MGGNFEHEFKVDGIMFKLFKIDDSYELKFNNTLFSHVYNGTKMREKYGYSMEDMRNSQKNSVNQMPQTNFDKGYSTFANNYNQNDSKFGNNFNQNHSKFGNNFENNSTPFCNNNPGTSFDPNVYANNQDMAKYNEVLQKPAKNVPNYNFSGKRKIFEESPSNYTPQIVAQSNIPADPGFLDFEVNLETPNANNSNLGNNFGLNLFGEKIPITRTVEAPNKIRDDERFENGQNLQSNSQQFSGNFWDTMSGQTQNVESNLANVSNQQHFAEQGNSGNFSNNNFAPNHEKNMTNLVQTANSFENFAPGHNEAPAMNTGFDSGNFSFKQFNKNYTQSNNFNQNEMYSKNIIAVKDHSNLHENRYDHNKATSYNTNNFKNECKNQNNNFEVNPQSSGFSVPKNSGFNQNNSPFDQFGTNFNQKNSEIIQKDTFLDFNIEETSPPTNFQNNNTNFQNSNTNFQNSNTNFGQTQNNNCPFTKNNDVASENFSFKNTKNPEISMQNDFMNAPKNDFTNTNNNDFANPNNSVFNQFGNNFEQFNFDNNQQNQNTNKNVFGNFDNVFNQIPSNQNPTNEKNTQNLNNQPNNVFPSNLPEFDQSLPQKKNIQSTDNFLQFDMINTNQQQIEQKSMGNLFENPLAKNELVHDNQSNLDSNNNVSNSQRLTDFQTHNFATEGHIKLETNSTISNDNNNTGFHTNPFNQESNQ